MTQEAVATLKFLSDKYKELNISDITQKIKNTYDDFSTDPVEKTKAFINKNFVPIIFGVCSIFTFQYAFSRFVVAAIITNISQDNTHQPQGPIISTTNLALNTVGALGLVLHKICSPFTNPLFYFAPVLSGVAFAKTMYALYRSYYPYQSPSSS